MICAVYLIEHGHCIVAICGRDFVRMKVTDKIDIVPLNLVGGS